MVSQELRNLEGLDVGKYRIEKRKGEGGCGVTYKAMDTSIGNYVAIKFLKTEDPQWKHEAYKAGRLWGVDQIARVLGYDETRVVVGGRSIELKYIVWEYIDGKTLEEFLEESHLTTDVIVEVTEQICYGIAGMQAEGMQHGDLHANNIMIVDPKEWDNHRQHKIKILDFGLAASVKNRTTTDLESLKQILLACWEKNQYYAGERLVKDKKFQELLSSLINRIEDPNPDRGLRDPRDIIKRINDIKEQASSDLLFQEVSLRNPFDYLSVEEMPENSDLVPYLYTDTVPWLKEISGFGTTIISGPRGSGKSMILKNMRLLTKLRARKFDSDSLAKLEYYGFYVHCHHSLYIPFAGFDKDYSAETLEQVIHYLNLLYTSEILEALISLERQQVISISPDSKQAIYDFLKENIFQDPAALVLSADSLLLHSKTIIEKEILLTQKIIIRKGTLKKRTAVAYLKNLIESLDEILDFFKKRPIYFLLDDYSNPKIKPGLQKSINRLVGFRNSRFCFKITTEKFGFVAKDLDGKDLQQDREFSFVDLGGRYIKYRKPERKEFINEIIRRRLLRAGISMSPGEFFGLRPTKGIAQALLKEKAGGRKAKTKVRYSGFDMIYKLCMGDLSTILQLCKEIYAFTLSQQSDVGRGIPQNYQDQLIRTFSQRRLETIKEISEYGERLYRVVDSFGNISKKYLYDYHKEKKKAKFLEVLRIELTESTDCLSPMAQEMFERLIRESIFLDAGGTYPWAQGKGVSNFQLLLRPIYTPALKISYANRYALKLSCSQFERFLTKPEEFEKTGTKFLISEWEEGSTLDRYV